MTTPGMQRRRETDRARTCVRECRGVEAEREEIVWDGLDTRCTCFMRLLWTKLRRGETVRGGRSGCCRC